MRESFRTLGHNPTEQELWKLLAQVVYLYLNLVLLILSCEWYLNI